MIKVYDILCNKNLKPYLKEVDNIKTNNIYLSTEEIVEKLNKKYNYNQCQSEKVYIAAFDYECKVLGIYMVSSGGNNYCNYIQKNIFTFLLLVGAEQFIIFHNHPNGNLKPSFGDDNAYQLTKQNAELFKIPCCDNIIVSKKGFYSFNNNKTYYS